MTPQVTSTIAALAVILAASIPAWAGASSPAGTTPAAPAGDMPGASVAGHDRAATNVTDFLRAGGSPRALVPDVGYSQVADLVPGQGDGGGRPLVSTRVTSATVSATPSDAPGASAPTGPASLLMPYGATLLILVAVGLSGVAVRRWKQRRMRSTVSDPVESWDPEECLRRTTIHIECENFDRAHEWITRARELAPTSSRAAATQGFILERLGRLDEALVAYEAAAGFSPEEGEHDVDAARVAALAGRPPRMVEDLLVRALAKSPCFVHQVEEDPAFLPLVGRPAYRRAVDAAWVAFAAELSDDAGDDTPGPGRNQPNH